MADPTVTLVHATPDAERTVCAAAKLCYAADAATVFDHTGDEIRSFIDRLRRMGHLSPFEHAAYTFLLEGVSRTLTHQLVRHRVASYSQRSQRYVTHESFEYITPPSLEGKTVETSGGTMDAAQYYAQFMAHAAEVYGTLREALGGSGERANEDARYVLPNATETKIMVTMNGREMFHFFGERLCRRAQWEIRTVAGRMLSLAKQESPALFAGIGPKCVRLGHCPEASMTCGQFTEIKALYTDT